MASLLVPVLLIIFLIILLVTGFAVYGLWHFIKSRSTAQKFRKRTSPRHVASPSDAAVSTEHTEISHNLSTFTPKESTVATSQSGLAPHAEEETEAAEATSLYHKIQGSPLLRCVLIGVITLILLIPLDFVYDIVTERESLHREATNNIASSWGKKQTISGPILVVPYVTWADVKRTVVVKVKGQDESKDVVEREYTQRYKVFLPNTVHFDATLDPEIRYRGIYRQALYNAPVAVNGSFILPTADKFAENLHAVQWEKAWFAIGITDLKTISDAPPVQWAGVTMGAYTPGTNAENILVSGFHADIPLNPALAGKPQDFSLTLQIRGSGGIYFTPVGEKSLITVVGSWPSPNFQGNLLPEERTITSTGFSAKWNISNLTRTYPQVGELGSTAFAHSGSSSDDYRKAALSEFSAGVDLQEVVSLYRMSLRAVKYGILFIAVSFVALFAFEMVTRKRMHLLQYAMVGLSMSLFYLVLLSLGEHTSFLKAFIAASTVTVLMNSLYIAAALRSLLKGLFMGILLCGLYSLLFALLRMEDFALLVGTGLVISMMAVLMFVTRRLARE